MAATRYPDLAHYNWPIPLNGAALVVYKATQGTSFVDQTYASAKAAAAAAGIRFVAYHWLDTADAVAQAKHCFGVVGPRVPLMIDDEQQRITVAHTLEFVHAYRALGGHVRLEYAPAWVWRNSSRPDLRPLADAGLLIVSSAYTTYSDTGPGWDSYGGITPTIWQYTSHQLWHGKYVDFNAFRGSADELWALITGDGGTDMNLTDVLPDGKTTVGQALLDTSRNAYLAAVRAGQAANVALPAAAVKLDKILAAAVANPASTVTMSDGDRAELALKLAEAIHAPTSAEVAKAVEDEAAARLKA